MEILPLVERTLDQENPRVWYWALMDLGAMLKKTVSNPNRRSSRYIRQAPFQGSDRQLRGIILRQLLRHRRLRKESIIHAMTADPERSNRIIDTLVIEGFLAYDNGGMVFIKE
jgi:A/G-specific adenine glycosylase